MAGRDEQRYCRGGNKISLFEIDRILVRWMALGLLVGFGVAQSRYPVLDGSPSSQRLANLIVGSQTLFAFLLIQFSSASSFILLFFILSAFAMLFNLPLLTPALQHSSNVLWAGFSPDGLRVVTGSEDQTARTRAFPKPVMLSMPTLLIPRNAPRQPPCGAVSPVPGAAPKASWFIIGGPLVQNVKLLFLVNLGWD